MILTPEELVMLTKRSKGAWQRRELDFLEIPYKQRSDGSLIVHWEDVRATHNVQSKPREPQVRLS
jgi:hypothetical protein